MEIDNAERKLERYKGKLMYKWHIIATVSSMAGTEQVKNCKVLAPNFLDAAEHVKAELIREGYIEVFEFHSKGPKGGKKYSSMGYESCIGRHMLGARK
jgi:hypothetical protein